MKLSRLFRSPIAVLAAVVIVSGSVFAFAAANTIDPSSAGAGSQAVSGYTTTDVTYKFTSANPETLEYVQFSLVPTIAGEKNAATHVVARLNVTDTYAIATLVGEPLDVNGFYSTTWKLTAPVSVTNITSLSVVAASGPIPVP